MYPGATTFYHVVQVIREDNQETVFTTDAPSFLHTDDFIDLDCGLQLTVK